MDLVKLGKKGQVTIPRAILRSVGLSEEAPLLVETTREGAILLKPAAVYPIEVYSDQRVAEFERENAVPEDLQAKVRAVLGRDI
ncbi:AbrB/MazE/SpoVT family DNA-binding domain-containing protein [Lamprobacter modestohalophilus]|uniref:AbrB/MazE/SpoVT family DNA-binding domain-containing protein n=1 Tax=Lamprobacter modestohalophilus TaxID=1064514 RepID=UPI002ADEE591|nr:AbrB/MazE/SpoVT family DNA-binding domain-containing protein [Lamprobacter modestohalophilus]MEA1051464.1 AbrB/MazE/SpoVT family DNA-binding domain-containing protein [Lamprobacter modestohalophilus]